MSEFQPEVTDEEMPTMESAPTPPPPPAEDLVKEEEMKLKKKLPTAVRPGGSLFLQKKASPKG